MDGQQSLLQVRALEHILRINFKIRTLTQLLFFCPNNSNKQERTFDFRPCFFLESDTFLWKVIRYEIIITADSD